jgi:hypothetical protein
LRFRVLIRDIRVIRGSDKNPNFPRYIWPDFLQYLCERKTSNMKIKMVSKILVSLSLVLVLLGAITEVHGGSRPTPTPRPQPTPFPRPTLAVSSAYSTGPEDVQLPVVTIHSTGDVLRGKTGSFVLNMNPVLFGGMYVNFSVSGTAIPGVDYVPLISPAYIGQSGYGVILVQTLPDRRGPASRQSYSVVVTLEPGPGYVVGEPRSAQMMIKP